MDPNSRKIKVLKSYIILILLTILSFDEIVNFGIPRTVWIYANVGKKICCLLSSRAVVKLVSDNYAQRGKKDVVCCQLYVKFGAG